VLAITDLSVNDSECAQRRSFAAEPILERLTIISPQQAVAEKTL